MSGIHDQENPLVRSLNFIAAALSDSLRYCWLLLPVWAVCTAAAVFSLFLCGLGQLLVVPPLLCCLVAVNLLIVRGKEIQFSTLFEVLPKSRQPWAIGGLCFVLLVVVALIWLCAGMGVEAYTAVGKLLSGVMFLALDLIECYICYRLTFAFLLYVDPLQQTAGPRTTRQLINDGLQLSSGLESHIFFAVGFITLGCLVLASFIAIVPIAAIGCLIQGVSLEKFGEQGPVTLCAIAALVGCCFSLGVIGLAVTYFYNDRLRGLGWAHEAQRHGATRSGWIALGVAGLLGLIGLWGLPHVSVKVPSVTPPRNENTSGDSSMSTSTDSKPLSTKQERE